MVGLLCLALVSIGSGCGRARYDGGPDTGMDAPRGDAPFASDDAGEDSPGPDAVVAADAFEAADAFASTDASLLDTSMRPDAFAAPDAFAGLDAFEAPDAAPEPDAAADPMCAAILADPSAFSDADVFRCGVLRQLGRCVVFDARACGVCACDYYVQNSGWDCPGTCPTDLTPTGCIEFRAGGLLPPTSTPECAASPDVESLGACVMRHEILAGHCAPCTC